MTDEPMDLVDFVHGSGAHVNADGETVAGAPVYEVDGRQWTSWDFGMGRAVDVWLDEIPALERDALLYGNIYLVKGASNVCDRIDPARVSPA